MKCPKCGNEWTATSSEMAAEFGRRTSKAKARAARRNAKLGGWPKGKKRGRRKPDANQIAHGVIAKAEKLTHDRSVLPHWPTVIKHIKRQGRSPRSLTVLPSPKSPKAGQ